VARLGEEESKMPVSLVHMQRLGGLAAMWNCKMQERMTPEARKERSRMWEELIRERVLLVVVTEVDLLLASKKPLLSSWAPLHPVRRPRRRPFRRIRLRPPMRSHKVSGVWSATLPEAKVN